MALFLTNSDIKGLHHRGAVNMADYVAAIQEAYYQHGAGQAQFMPRENLWVEKTPQHPEPLIKTGHYLKGKAFGSLKVQACCLPALGVIGVMSYAAGFNRPTPEMWLLLYRAQDGELEAVIQTNYSSWMKTGAVAAVAAKFLAPSRESYTVGIFGAGRQAWTQILGLASIFKIKGIKVYSRTEEKRNAFVQRVANELKLPAVSVATPQKTIQDSELVVTITTAREPVFKGEWLEPGTHINALGAHYPEIREVDDETVRRSRIVVDVIEQALKEKGDLLIPMAKGVITKEDLHAELGEVVYGSKPGRLSDSDITLFCSGGTALEVVGASRMIVERARQSGLGIEIQAHDYADELAPRKRAT